MKVVKCVKFFDKFLKILKTDRNTFLTYILTLITLYICVDRFIEMCFIFFTGVPVSYWGPIKYTLAMAAPVFAFLFSGNSKFVHSNNNFKVRIFYIYCIALYIIGISMVVSWLNELCWLFMFSVPNYTEIIMNFSDLIQPALTSIALYIPLTTFYPIFKFLFFVVNDTLDIKKSIWDYRGINLSDNSEKTGPYTCEIKICTDRLTNKAVKIPESRRFEATLIVGVSGTGKTSMVFEPMMARDLERKFFYKEVSKEMAYTALKTGIASLNCPYDNDYINENFELSMISPNSNKEKLYKTYMHKLIYDTGSSSITYKNLGFTAIAPDYESISHVAEVAKNFSIPVNIIDPSNSNSIGLNPFIHKHAPRTAILISSILKGMYATTHPHEEETFMENVTTQAVENLVLLLKVMYPILHEGLLPNLEDLLKMLNDFDLVEEMCEQLKSIPELAEEYSLVIGYFEKNFYRRSEGRKDTERFVYSAITELDNLLRYPGVKNILCNRTNNIDFDKVLEKGQVNLVCTRRGDLGDTAHKAFGLFCILLMQYSVLNRPGVEKSRVPHFLYIDEFPDFACRSTEALFTLYRKYRVGTIVSAQNIGQFGDDGARFRQTLLANCTTKVVFGNNTPEDNAWWSKEIGDHREWKYVNDYHTDQTSYDANLKSVKWDWKENLKPGQIQALKFKQVAYKTKDLGGKNLAGAGFVDFLESKYKEQKELKKFNFAKFNGGAPAFDTAEDDEEDYKKYKFVPKRINFDTAGDINVDPIQTDITDSKYLFDNEDAISFNLGAPHNNDN